MAKLSSLKGKDILAISVECTFRNMSLAVAIKAILFPAIDGQVDPIGDGIFFTALLYGGVSLFMCLPPVLLSRFLWLANS